MSTHYKGFIVALEKDMRDDDAEELMHAIRCLRFVLKVEPLESQGGEWVTEHRVKQELRDKLWAIIDGLK